MVAQNPKDTATLVMSGAFRLTDFARAVQGFDHLIDKLRLDYGDGLDVPWLVDHLDATPGDRATTRAITSTRGAWTNPSELRGVETVVTEYETVGRALERRAPLSRFSKDVETAAKELQHLLNGHVRAFTFQTSEVDAEVVAAPVEVQATLLAPPIKAVNPYSFAAIRGRVESMSRRGGLRFTLYDINGALPISCYLSRDQEVRLKELWGKLVVVEGTVRRDPATGEPTTIRQITDIQEVPEERDKKWEFERARGVTSKWLTGPSMQQIIRRSRDG